MDSNVEQLRRQLPGRGGRCSEMHSREAGDATRPDEGAEPGQTVAHHCADIDVRLFWLLLPAVATCASHLARWAVGTPYCVSRVGIWIKSHHGLPGRLLLSLRRPLLAGVGRWY